MSVHRICEFDPFWTKNFFLQKDTQTDGRTHRRRRSNSSLNKEKRKCQKIIGKKDEKIRKLWKTFYHLWQEKPLHGPACLLLMISFSKLYFDCLYCIQSYQTWVVSPMSIWIRAQLPGEIRYNSCHINVTKSVRSLSTRQWHIGSNSSLWLRIPTLTEICPSRLVSWVPKTITVYFSRVSWIKEIHAKGLFTTSKSSQRVLHLPFQTHRECF